MECDAIASFVVYHTIGVGSAALKAPTLAPADEIIARLFPSRRRHVSTRVRNVAPALKKSLPQSSRAAAPSSSFLSPPDAADFAFFLPAEMLWRVLGELAWQSLVALARCNRFYHSFVWNFVTAHKRGVSLPPRHAPVYSSLSTVALHSLSIDEPRTLDDTLQHVLIGSGATLRRLTLRNCTLNTQTLAILGRFDELSELALDECALFGVPVWCCDAAVQMVRNLRTFRMRNQKLPSSELIYLLANVLTRSATALTRVYLVQPSWDYIQCFVDTFEYRAATRHFQPLLELELSVTTHIVSRSPPAAATRYSTTPVCSRATQSLRVQIASMAPMSLNLLDPRPALFLTRQLSVGMTSLCELNIDYLNMPFANELATALRACSHTLTRLSANYQSLFCSVDGGANMCAALPQLVSLRQLSLDGCHHVAAAHISTLTNLEQLSLRYSESVRVPLCAAVVSLLPRVHTLCFDGCWSIDDSAMQILLGRPRHYTRLSLLQAGGFLTQEMLARLRTRDDVCLSI